MSVGYFMMIFIKVKNFCVYIDLVEVVSKFFGDIGFVLSW